MSKIFKNRFLKASAFLLIIEIIGAFAIMAPILVYYRLQFEHSLLVKEFWPIITPDLLADIILNYNQALAIFLIAGFIIYLAYFPIKALAAAGIYKFLATGNHDAGNPELLRSAYGSWAVFIKISLFAVPIYLLALFIGMSIGGLFESIGRILMLAITFLFLLSASSYVQILRLHAILAGNSSLKNAILNTRKMIRGALMRILLGNISVMIAAIIVVILLWLLLTAVRGFNWNFLTAVLSFAIQQLMVFAVCLAQIIRVNFQLSLFRRGEHDIVG